MKEINTNRSSKIEFKLVKKEDNFEVKEFLEKMVHHVVKSEKKVIEVADEDKDLQLITGEVWYLLQWQI